MATIATNDIPAAQGAPDLSVAPPLTTVTRLSYGVGAVANGVKNAAFSSYLMLYYNQVIGVPASIVSLAIAATLIVDALADPLIGRWSDVTRTRWGRRHPFIFGAALPTACFFILAWFPPAGMSHLETGLWIFFTAMAARVSISAFEINSSAMTPELTGDYQERTRLFGLRYWFGYAGAFGFTALSLATIFAATPDYPRGQLNPAGYTWFAFFGGATIFVAILLCGIGTMNRIPWLRQADIRPARVAGTRRPSTFGRHLREMAESLKNRAFLSIFGFGVLKYSAIGLYSATSLYFGTYLFKLNGAQLALLTFDSLVAATLAAPLAPVVSNWIGKRNASMIFAVIGVALGLSPLLLSLNGLFFLPGDPRLVPTLFVIGALYGAMVAISLINTSAMLADVVEDSAVRTGRHDAGRFFAASSFMQQASAGVGNALAGAILTASNFPARADPASVTPAMLDSLMLHYIPTSMGLWTLGCLFLLFYPITREKHEANVEALRARAAEARERELRDAPVGGPAR